MNFVAEVTRNQTMRWSAGSTTTWFGTERRSVPIVVVVTPELLALSFFEEDLPGVVFVG
jgi:hypothetical protein